MEQLDFVKTVQANQQWLRAMEKEAFAIHDRVNQRYGKFLPYGFHLKLTASYVSRYGYLVAETEADVLVLYASAYLHDTIEDARMTYNDVVKFVRSFKPEGTTLPDASKEQLDRQVPEIVYALTNEKGRNRDERANAAYYKGICETKFASFVKMCDRLANLRFTVMFVFANYMFDVYKKEYPDFIRKIDEGAVTPIPEVMKQEAEDMLRGEVYVLEG